ncbi:MAG: alanine racemase [Anaerolineae bacterium]|nr:alanine racemase [Anaerolineae bacterium]
MFTSEAIQREIARFTTSIIIDLDAIAHNVQAVRQHVGPDVSIFAVVKDNAYGHGAVQVSPTILQSGASRLAISRIQEGVQLRRAGISAPILNMCYSVPAELEGHVAYDIASTIVTIEGAQVLSRVAGALGTKATVHIKVDTGLSRFGLLPGEVLPFLEAIRDLPGLNIEGLFTHFASADEADKSFTHHQLDIFNDTVRAVRAAGFPIQVRHAANSAASMDLPETHFEAVRPGITLYGLYPAPTVSHPVTLHPALSLISHLGRIREMPAGTSVSYGRTFIASQPVRVGLVMVGYGDGFRRSLSGKGRVLVAGKPAPEIGRVCMDQFMVDLSAVPEAQEGDPVVVIGSDGRSSISADDIAGQAGTINHEVFTGLSCRIPRIYVREGQVVDLVE